MVDGPLLGTTAAEIQAAIPGAEVHLFGCRANLFAPKESRRRRHRVVRTHPADFVVAPLDQLFMLWRR